MEQTRIEWSRLEQTTVDKYSQEYKCRLEQIRANVDSVRFTRAEYNRLEQTRGVGDGVRITRVDQSRLEQTRTEVSTIREQIRAD